MECKQLADSLQRVGNKSFITWSHIPDFGFVLQVNIFQENSVKTGENK